jgi:multisubunit Na+/H+ antiporter MnhG subunit
VNNLGFIGFLVLVADIYAIVKVAQSGATLGIKLLWIAVVVFFPLAGLLVWFLFGPGGRQG